MGKTKSITVNNKKMIIKLFEGKTQENHKKGAGRPKVTNPRSERILSRIIANEPFSNLSEYAHAMNAKGIQISRATIHRRMGSTQKTSLE